MERGYTRTALGPLLNIQSYSQENTQYPLDVVFREIDVVDLRQISVRNTCSMHKYSETLLHLAVVQESLLYL